MEFILVFLKLKQDFNLGTLIAYLIIEYNLKNIQNKVGNRLFTVKINRYKKLDFFTSNDIQEENIEITKLFIDESLNYIDDYDIIENETIAKFLINVSVHIINQMIYLKIYSRSSQKLSKEDKNISTLKKDEELRKKFSS